VPLAATRSQDVAVVERRGDRAQPGDPFGLYGGDDRPDAGSMDVGVCLYGRDGVLVAAAKIIVEAVPSAETKAAKNETATAYNAVSGTTPEPLPSPNSFEGGP